MPQRIRNDTFAFLIELLNKTHRMSLSCACISIDKHKSIVVRFIRVDSFYDFLDQLAASCIKHALYIDHRIKYVVKSVYFSV